MSLHICVLCIFAAQKTSVMTPERKYPVGIQTFERLRKENYVYIDKTDLVWKLTKESPYVFLSRPRRFGKSLLSTTLASYFKGEKELFEGLKIMELEAKWEQYPVIHVDLSVTKAETSVEGLRNVLFRLLEEYKSIYGEGAFEDSPGGRFSGIIHRAYKMTGKQVVVIVDEYDAPLLDKLHAPELLEAFRNVMQEFYVQLKANEAMIRFCFITGITKFSQLSIFSTINNLTNISMDAKYAAICGITEEELSTDMSPDIAMLAETYKTTPGEMQAMLKQQYDGYRFSEESPDIYNPFSLLKCFNQRKMAPYWFDSGTPSFLIRQMQHFRTDITTLERMDVPVSAFDRPTEAMTNALPLLYQSGYLTIKGYDRLSQLYTLSIPNQEVRIGFTEGLLPTYIGLDGAEVQTGFALKFWLALRQNDIDLAMSEMKAFFAGLPYVEGFKEKLKDVKNYEGFFEWSVYLIISMLNVYVRTQVKCAGGRTDVVVWMPDITYVLELKVNGTAREALEQIDSKGYALPYRTEGRKVVKVGVAFVRETMTVGEYLVEEE